jgi:hypothetical protein
MIVRRKIVEHSMLLAGVKTRCQFHFQFRSYGGITICGFSKIDFFVTEGAQIADDGQKQKCRATHVTFGSENRMSIPLPVRSYGGKTLPGWPNWLKEHR